MGMTLDKAIEIANLYEHAASSIPREDFLDTLTLLIEAGKRILKYRQDPIHVANLPLPGETKE